MNGLLIAWVNLNCQFLHSTGQSKYPLNERQSCRKSNRFTLLVKITLGWQVQIILKVDPPLLRSVSLFTAFCDWYFKDPLMISRGSETGEKKPVSQDYAYYTFWRHGISLSEHLERPRLRQQRWYKREKAVPSYIKWYPISRYSIAAL